MKYSFVIPTYNEEQYIETCLKSIVNQQYNRKDYEIIVSDANSTDRTRDIAKKYADHIVTTSQRGIALGRNLGAQHARGEILIFVDCDVILVPSYLTLCDDVFRNSSIVGFCGKAIPMDGSFIHRCVYYGTFFLVRFFALWGLHLYPGICVAYKRSAFHQIGGFRTDLGISEDLDLSRRVSRMGTCVATSTVVAYVSTRRLQHHCVSTVLFHLWNHCKYLVTGKSANYYPKTEEVKTWRDLWGHNK